MLELTEEDRGLGEAAVISAGKREGAGVVEAKFWEAGGQELILPAGAKGVEEWNSENGESIEKAAARDRGAEKDLEPKLGGCERNDL